MCQFDRLHLRVLPLSLHSLCLLQLHCKRSLCFFSTFFGILKGFGSGFGSAFFSSFFLFSSAAFFSTGFGLTVTFPVLSSLPLLFSKTTLKSPMSSIVQEAIPC